MRKRLRKPKIPIESFRDFFADRERFDVAVPLMPTARVVHVRNDALDVLNNARLDIMLELIRGEAAMEVAKVLFEE